MQTTFGDWTIALGIDWSMPSNAREIRTEKKRRTKQDFVLSSVAGQNWLGFHAPITGKVYAGALLVAMVKPNAVVYCPCDDSNAWVCAIYEGMPVVGHDKVLPIAEARNTAVEWSSMFAKAEVIGDIAGARATFADVIAVLDEGLAAKVIQKKQVAVALLNKHGISYRQIAVVALGGCLLVGSFFAFQTYRDIQRRNAASQLSFEDGARQAVMSANGKARIEAEQTAKAAAYKSQIESALRDHTKRTSVAALWSAFVAVRQSLPVSMNGYKPQAVDCTAQHCRVTWQGAGRFTSAAGKLSLPNVERNLTADLSAVSVFPVSVGDDAMPASQARTAEELRFIFQSYFGVHVTSFQADAMQAVLVNPPAGLAVAPKVVAEIGKWRMQIQAVAAVIDAKTMLGMLAKWPARVQMIRYQPAAGLVDVEGEYVFLTEKKV
jgi:hypothetical protein